MKPSHNEAQWYKLDDEMVTKVEEKEAVQDNYGGPMVYILCSSNVFFVVNTFLYACIQTIAPF